MWYIPGLIVLALLMPVIYGGIHLSVWNFEFPTVLEKLLWKIASVGITATLPVLFALACGGEDLPLHGLRFNYLLYPPQSVHRRGIIC
ncbi:hypothetical protein CJF30_00010057 [Rutstroemia sp. NJR-2017a BBW]|nr:hypothetical protein CJF30_00010057 [Rutstroemia sp. NJR-2017a BBW]